MVQTARVAGLGNLSRGPDGCQASAWEVDWRPGGRQTGVGGLVGGRGVGLLDREGSVVAGTVVGLRVGGGLEVLLQQREISQYQRTSRAGTEISIKCSRLVVLQRKDLLLDGSLR